MKQVKDWKEPWKKKEPGARLSKRERYTKKLNEDQRAHMDAISTQKVTVTIHKNLLGTPGLFKSFTVRVKIPLNKTEIDERIRAAFPELPWSEN